MCGRSAITADERGLCVHPARSCASSPAKRSDPVAAPGLALTRSRSPDAVQRGAKRNGAPLIRGLPKRGACQERGACDGPGSAAHRSTSFRAALRPGYADRRCAAPGKRGSMPRCARETNNVTFPGCGAARSGAPLIRGLRKRRVCQERGACDGPGSAAHRCALRRARDTRIDTALRPGNKQRDVPRMRCSTKWCTADPGPSQAARVLSARSL